MWSYQHIYKPTSTNMMTRQEIEMHLRAGNSESADDSAVSCWAKVSRIFWGYDDNGCVCSGVNTGADRSDLWGNIAPARWNKQILYRTKGIDKQILNLKRFMKISWL